MLRHYFYSLMIGLSLLHAESLEVSEHEAQQQLELRGLAESSSAITFKVPVHYLAIRSIVADGAKVKKGQTLCVFDKDASLYELERLELKKKIFQSDLQRRLIEIANKNREKNDQIARLKDQLKVEKASLTRLKALPLKDDILLAEGQLRIAQLEFDSADKDLIKARKRKEKNYLSEVELNNYLDSWKEKKTHYQHAKDLYEYSQLRSSKSTLRKAQLKIDNTQIQIGKLSFELKESESLIKIQKKRARRRSILNQRAIDELEKNIQKTIVTAPRDGSISYLKSFTNIEAGARLPRGTKFMTMPEVDKIEIRFNIPEKSRKYYAVGDRVEISTAASRGQVFHGKIKEISILAEDLAEQQDASWGRRDKKSGIKVFSSRISLDAVPAHLKPGMYCKVQLKSKVTISGPAVPFSFIQTRNQEFFLSQDGQYQAVKGFTCGPYFFLEDQQWLGKKVQASGRFNDDLGQPEKTTKGLLLSGHLRPRRSRSITLAKIRGSQAITWLIGESTQVKKGELLAKIDPSETDKNIREKEAEINNSLAELQESQKSIATYKTLQNLNLKKLKNELETAEINHYLSDNSLDAKAYYNARRDQQIAELKERQLRDKVEREKKQKPSRLSPRQFVELKRKFAESQLQRQISQIQFKQAQETYTPLEKSERKLQVQQKKTAYLIEKEKTSFNLFEKNTTIKNKERALRKLRRQLKKLQNQKEELSVFAPTKGIVSFEKVYDSGALRKISVGAQVRRGNHIMSIPDLREMLIVVSVPEKYFTKIKTGMSVQASLPSLNKTSLAAKVIKKDIIFQRRQRKDSQLGLYSSHEPLGENFFQAYIALTGKIKGLKPELLAEVLLPINGEDE